MKLQISRPIAFFDIESTGINTLQDRVIDLAVVKLMPDGSRETFSWRLNPGMPIPRSSTAIHGITDADVVNSPSFRDKAAEILAFFDGCDLAGFNVLGYDIPLLQEEFKRVNMVFDMTGRNIVDGARIFHQKERRTLTAALKFYCNDEHTNAHGALADVEATIRVVEGQLDRYDDLPGSIEELSAFCNPRNPNAIDAQGKIVWNDDNEAAINFGKNQGQTLRALVRNDAGFLQWILKKDFAEDTKTIVRAALAGNFPVRKVEEPEA
ncbi:MAG: exonuclease domain-containing protein [Kiritimatiellia bacterium]